MSRVLRERLGRASGRILGIDAGGSSTRAVVVQEGRITGSLRAGPMNALLTRGIAERVADLARRVDPVAIGLGMPGVRSDAVAQRIGEAIACLVGCPVRVTSDAQVAMLGAFLGAPGLVVVAGTGSVALGSDGDRMARAGGHGFLLGDDGGAYWIGREAVRAALRWEDSMGGSEALYRGVLRASGRGLRDLINAVHANPAERNLLACIAPMVTEVAATDAGAREIAREAAAHLAELARAVQMRIGALAVSGVGGVFEAPVVWSMFAEVTGACRPLAAPAVGAALLAGAPEERALA